MKTKINVGVIFGGRSVENEISVLTAIQAMEAINTEKYDITPIYISKEGRWYTGEALRQSSNYKNMEQPWRNDPTFCVFSSSRSDQVSYACDETRTGFFTYYLAAGLQGDADVNADGKVTMKELKDFVISNVDKETGGKQIPQFYGTREDFIVEKIR